MVEDDHKLIVETETVEAPVSSLLIASTGTGNGGLGGTSNGPKAQHNDATEHGVPPSAMKAIAASSLGSKNEPGSSKKSYSGMLTGNSSIAHESLAGGGSISGSNINLIDNNPLSPHVTQASVRNKKSSLLIDSSNDNSPDPEEVPRGRPAEGDKNGPTLRKHMEEIANANRDDAEAKANEDYERTASRSAQSSKTNITVPTPLMLPVATHAIAGAVVPPTSTVSATTGTQANRPSEGKPSKIIERPPMTATKSRDVLLDDEVRKKVGASGAATSGANASGDSANPNRTSTLHSEDIHHDLDSLHKPTKADFFAARLASAVGENEISDSEETFIYESAANSTKNAVPASGFDQHNDHNQLQHGIASKMSVPVLNNNAKLLTRLKNTRHTSMSALPMNASTKHANEVGNNRNEPQIGSTSAAKPVTSTPNEEVASVKFPDNSNGAKSNDMQSVESVHSELRSPDKRHSLTFTGKQNPAASLPTQKNGHTSRKPSVSNSTLRHVSSTQAGAARGKFIARPDGDNSGNHKRNLRTTASKIFDANGAPLRRYSGVPDDVNLEDFIEQSNGNYMTNNGNQRDDRSRSIAENNNNNDKRFSRDMSEAYHRSAIQEEEGENEGDDDDLRSMFYYNHRGDLEARPQISDYEEDGEGIEDDHHDDKYFNTSYGNTYNGNSNNNYDNIRSSTLLESQFSPSAMHFSPHNMNQSNSNGPNNPQFNANEQTPLRPRKRLSRNQLSYSPHNFYTRKSSWAKVKHCVYFTFVVISLLTVGFILGFLLATNKELQGLNIVIMDNILSSSDELLFDVTVTAFNPGFFAIGVQDVNLDIFAKSSHITKGTNTNSDSNKSPSQETVLLGTVYCLETSLKFEGGFLKRSYDVSVSTVKLLDPGSKTDAPDDEGKRSGSQQNKDDVAKWKALIQHEYELIVRGSMQYKIPFFRSNKSTAVQSSADVHPGKDGDDDDDDAYNFLLL